jgi:hypothetical protein
MNIYILIKGQWFNWHMYLLIDKFDYNGLFDKLYNHNQNDQWFLIKLNV